ncbi:MAG TPA: AMIN domain-containing protein, partial [Candidatus Angelobacter sp.]
MRLKQLLGIVLLASVSAMAADTVSQLGDVQVKNQNSAAAPRAGATTRIGKISVARGGDGLNIEISGSGPMTARTMKLTHPDRIVVDIPNSELRGHAREIPVNSG